MTRTTTRPATEGQQTTRSGRPATFHYIPTVALSFAREAGVQARAICGRWIHPDVTASSSTSLGTTARVCGNCRRIAAARARHTPQG